MLKRSHSEFIEQLEKKQPKLFEEIEVIGEYKTIMEKILVKTKYGKCLVTPNSLLQGHLPCIRRALNPTEYFINMAKEVHGDEYNYSLVDYKSAHVKVKIISEHGVFEQSPASHLQGQGCPKVGVKKRILNKFSTTKKFIKKAQEVHGNFYDYSKVDYINNTTKIEIISEYGSFWQMPKAHLAGQGCPKVAYKNKGWTYTKWEKAAQKSKHFDSFKVYIIKCWNNNEVFYKIGKTYNTLKRRFDKKNILPYNYLEIKVFTGTAENMSKLEHKLQKLHKEFKYLPLLKFGGMTECFSQLIDFE